MKTQFDHENEAVEALDAARLEYPGFCPLIRRDCMKNCVCYYKGDIQEPVRPQEQKGYWTVYSPCCTNVLISGEIIADVRY